MRNNSRQAHELRPVSMQRNYTQYAEGSVLTSFGNTIVLCNASIIKNCVPKFRKNAGQGGWLTAEYSMLPRATHERSDREASRGKLTGRTYEIQRLIARSLRNCIDLSKLGEHSITLDCDVIQADGGTRTAAITGSCIALLDAINYGIQNKLFPKNIWRQRIAAISTGIFKGQALLDLDYAEDSQAETDANIVMDEAGNFIEIQGTAEKKSFSSEQLIEMCALAQTGIKQLFALQYEVLP